MALEYYQNLTWLAADWPAPDNIKAGCSTRCHGVSEGVYQGLNLGDHVDDDPVAVEKNRRLLIESLSCPNTLLWLQQTHSDIAIEHQGAINQPADACYTQQPGKVCVVMSADCLPILMCNQSGTEIAAIHAGWRGMAKGIIEKTLQQLTTPAEQLLVWFGPAISIQHYEVGPEVKQPFMQNNLDVTHCFKPGNGDRCYASLTELAKTTLQQAGIKTIYGGDYCTFEDADLFYSYRRDGITGRQASLIWFDN